VSYDSEEGVAWGERFMKFVNDGAHDYSEKLARERGDFPNWANSHWDTKYDRPMRNSCSTTVAPTGTISILADCSGGIEPMFSLAFIRNVLKGQSDGEAPMVEINKTFERVARARGFYSEGLMEQVARDGTLAHIDSIPDDVKQVFVCAHDVKPEWHIKMQAAFQRHCDSSISKTINFAHDAKKSDVDRIYRTAYELRCKGVTVYRDGCRAGQPMALTQSDQRHKQMNQQNDAPTEPTPVSTSQPEMKISTEMNLFGEKITEVKKTTPALEPRELPSITSGIRIRQQTPFGNMHIQITVDPHEEREVEVFAQLGKGGDLATSDLEAICRMISLWLRAGGRLRHVIKQLSGIGSSLQIPTRHGRIMSLGDGLAHALKRYTRAKERHGLRALLLGEIDPERIEDESTTPGAKGGNGNGGDITIQAASRLADPGPGAILNRHSYRLKCPECGGDLDTGENCVKCHGCGFAQC
jgi:ribonucleoside-diphosphate reductase alpha chain